jgi:membrane protein implicated in regulation of membrane protease activity
MLTLTTGLLLLAVIVVALYAFGVFDTPYLGAFRFTFYLLLVLLALAVWSGSMNPSHEGYDPTVGAR